MDTEAVNENTADGLTPPVCHHAPACADARRVFGTVPNLVTLLRPVGTPLFVLCCLQAEATAAGWARGGALLLFAIIAGSDMLDGWLARRYAQESPLGRTLDHCCDILFILLALGNFVMLGLVPWWLPVAIAWAFAWYVFDSWWRTAAQSQRLLLGSRLGHLSGILNYIAVGVVTVNLSIPTALLPPLAVWSICLGLALLALLSGTERLWRFLRTCLP